MTRYNRSVRQNKRLYLTNKNRRNNVSYRGGASANVSIPQPQYPPQPQQYPPQQYPPQPPQQQPQQAYPPQPQQAYPPQPQQAYPPQQQQYPPQPQLQSQLLLGPPSYISPPGLGIPLLTSVSNTKTGFSSNNLLPSVKSGFSAFVRGAKSMGQAMLPSENTREKTKDAFKTGTEWLVKQVKPVNPFGRNVLSLVGSGSGSNRTKRNMRRNQNRYSRVNLYQKV